MKIRISKLLTAVVLASLTAVSCIKEDTTISASKNEGSLILSTMSMDFEAALEITPTRASEINTADFAVSIYDSEGALSGSWIYSQLPDKITLPIGQYTLKITSGTAAEAAWDAPCYGAEKPFSIEKDKTTDLGTVTCSLSNIMVSVNYSDYMLSKLGDDCQVTVTIGAGELTFKKGETRIGYFEAASQENIMTAEFTGTIDEEFYADTDVFDGVKAGQFQKIVYSLKENPDPDKPEGGAHFNFTIDVTCQVVDVNKNIDITEDVIPDPDKPDQPGDDKGNPTIEWIGGDIDQPYTLTTTDTTQVKIPISIDAPNGIEGFTVDIISTASVFSQTSLIDLGLDSHLDFINPGSTKDGLESLGFSTGDDVKGKTHMNFNITTFVPLFIVANNEDVNFKLTITDAKGHTVEKTLMLKIKL